MENKTQWKLPSHEYKYNDAEDNLTIERLKDLPGIIQNIPELSSKNEGAICMLTARAKQAESDLSAALDLLERAETCGQTIDYELQNDLTTFLKQFKP